MLEPITARHTTSSRRREATRRLTSAGFGMIFDYAAAAYAAARPHCAAYRHAAIRASP